MFITLMLMNYCWNNQNELVSYKCDLSWKIQYVNKSWDNKQTLTDNQTFFYNFKCFHRYTTSITKIIPNNKNENQWTKIFQYHKNIRQCSFKSLKKKKAFQLFTTITQILERERERKKTCFLKNTFSLSLFLLQC